jgi:hypothetical protein
MHARGVDTGLRSIGCDANHRLLIAASGILNYDASRKRLNLVGRIASSLVILMAVLCCASISLVILNSASAQSNQNQNSAPTAVTPNAGSVIGGPGANQPAQPPNLQCQGCHGPGKQLPYMAGSLFHNGPHTEYSRGFHAKALQAGTKAASCLDCHTRNRDMTTMLPASDPNSTINRANIAETCGRRLVPCTLELGGKDPMIVCADADLVRAARGAVYGAFANSGQVCTSTERVYVVDDVVEEFTRRVLEETAALRQGSAGEFDVGAIACPQQLEIIESHVADAVARGARVLAGGRRNPAHRGLFYEPTVLEGVNHQMRIMREETFGPVLPIMRVADEGEALRLANDTVYGLNASIFTGDRRHGVELAKQVESGCVVVNDCMLTYGVPESPFGGVKESGIGRVNGEIGLRSYCNLQSILIDRVGSQSEPLWYPYSARKLTLIQRAIKVLWGTPLGRLLS